MPTKHEGRRSVGLVKLSGTEVWSKPITQPWLLGLVCIPRPARFQWSDVINHGYKCYNCAPYCITPKVVHRDGISVNRFIGLTDISAIFSNIGYRYRLTFNKYRISVKISRYAIPSGAQCAKWCTTRANTYKVVHKWPRRGPDRQTDRQTDRVWTAQVC